MTQVVEILPQLRQGPTYIVSIMAAKLLVKCVQIQIQNLLLFSYNASCAGNRIFHWDTLYNIHCITYQ